MDEASRIVSELHTKLAELDQKVWKYRQDMASEFDKYLEGLLRNVPTAVSETVSRTIAESLKDYRALYPTEASSIEPGKTGSRPIPNGGSHDRPVSPNSQPHPYVDGPRSPHARDLEFRGVFTPSFLPLLENSREGRRASHDSVASAPAELKAKEMDTGRVDASTSTRSTPTPDSKRPPTPKRRNTDEASIQSDWSDGPVRRSALRRRTSSTSKGMSPRRVRFDVEGEEVLPTSSPAPAPSPLLLADTNSSLLDSDDEGDEQIEDIDSPPPPKRISSSQALRALSRSPLADDGTQWITVSAPPDGSASVATTNGFTLDSDDDEDEDEVNNGIRGLSIKSPPSPNPAAVPSRSVDDEAETPSDDDMLDMPPLRRQSASPASMLSPAISPNLDNNINTSPTASTRQANTPTLKFDTPKFNMDEHVANEELQWDDDENAGLFAFDEAPPRSQRPPSTEEEQEDEEEHVEAPDSPKSPTRKPDFLSQYSSSPARDIVRPPPPPKVAIPTSKGIVGSYKGRPFSMPIVSPEVHAQAASMGNMSSFVGSVHGTTGLDESDTLSFRRSGGVGSWEGKAGSLSQRMMLEDLMEEESRRSSQSGTSGP